MAGRRWGQSWTLAGSGCSHLARRQVGNSESKPCKDFAEFCAPLPYSTWEGPAEMARIEIVGPLCAEFPGGSFLMKRSMPSSNLDRFTSRTLGLETRHSAGIPRLKDSGPGWKPLLMESTSAVPLVRVILEPGSWLGGPLHLISKTLREEHAAVQIGLALVS